MHLKGRGIPQNQEEAAKWFHMVALQDHVNAEFQLAMLYNTGQGMIEDHIEALKWFKLAAHKGHLNAQYCLGLLYEKNRILCQQKSGYCC